MIHVAYCTSNLYSKFAATSMLSLFENTTAPPHSVIVHILHDNTLSQENRDKFIYIAGRYNQQVKFYNVEQLCADKIEEIIKLFPHISESVLTIASFYRLLLVDVLYSKIKKVIYLDSDIIVNLDISELWQIELGDNVFAAVSEFENGVPQNIHTICSEKIIDGSKYFNSGVLLINLLQFKNEQAALKDATIFIANNPKYGASFDQDILNYCFLKKSIFIPKKFNVLVEYARRLGDFEVEQRICHYINSSRGIGFGLNTTDPYNRLFVRYFSKTPFFNEETIGRLYEGVQQLYIKQKNFACQVSALMSGKTRAFFVPSYTIKAIKKIFQVQDGEEIILEDSPNSLQAMIISLKKSGGKKVFFILSDNFLVIYNNLIQADFTADKDFVNAIEFLSDAEGLPLNPYSFIKLL